MAGFLLGTRSFAAWFDEHTNLAAQDDDKEHYFITTFR